MTFVRVSSLFLVVVLALIGACTRAPLTPSPPPPPKVESVQELREHLLTHKTELDLFMQRGPFEVLEERNHELRLSASEHINTDVFLTAAPGKAPLVIILHGYDSSKEAHANQAMHLASWGVHCVTVQLGKQGPFVAHGKTLERIVRLVHRSPAVVDGRVDVNRIILVGHSFGASSAAIALAEGAPASGAVFLDPAAVGRDLVKFLQRVDKPVLILGADDDITTTRFRNYFYEYIRRNIAELSIREATHEDAQYPSETALQNGIDPHTTEELQIAFAAALTSAALSLSTTGAFEYAWTTFAPAFENGKFFNARRK